ncbi:aminotransferase class I/II-fold pyridoxal phosphate-dependent enzyme [Haloferax sp. MBLA0076]|uniref:Aminotransferase class I/II-fold pyridoxal phosphate-dependent enzyme n=1 Tax=Haloferax litoreum TaxID=2666140 RepID=A0A6A8GE94_9EURY|nr:MULTISPECIES: histidinol-phosphate transaminase [Haloferax]KAB1192349.1 aminotransferase class I/II-fold pyridoxal phosphate-dependent enzyme [Haloferax sp. CBA1148]MRX20812.1 aminotransferase class I/II-fold pyridoxal phosphate-dependent enzyme [Haloferax litoreum]
MDPGSVPDVDPVTHGGTADHTLVDFSLGSNPERPPGLAGIYESAFSTSRRYSLDDYSEFRVAAAEYVGCDPDQIVPSAGVIEGLRLAIGVTVSPGDTVAIPAPCCGEYAREIRLQGGEPVHVPYDRILDDVDPGEHAAVILSHPSNPMGSAYPTSDLRAFVDECQSADTPLLVDESFLGFTRLPSTAGLDGVITLHSVTNVFGVPSLRAGFAAATGELRDKLTRARCTWVLSAPAVEAATYCLKQEEFLEETRDRIARERPRMVSELETFGYEVYPADSSLVLFRADDVDRVLGETRKRGYAVRDARYYRGLDSHVRINVRRPHENDGLLDALAEAV